MQKKILLIMFALCLQIQALTFYSDLHCTCESYTVNECKFQYYENCKVSGSECITYTFSCADMTKTECASYKYQCQWDSSCVDYSFQCSDFNSDQAKCQEYNCEWKYSSCTEYDYTCSNFKSPESCPCLWNKTNVCEEFSQCENYSKEECPSNDKYGCKETDTGCITIACNDIKVESDCEGYVNDDTICAWNNNGECVELASDSTCTDLDDIANICTFLYGCNYSDGSCTFKKCGDFSQEDCELKHAYVGKYEYNLCTVSESKCVEMADTTKLTQDNCISETSNNYHWTNAGKCEKCADLKSESSSSQIILGMIMMLYLVP